MKPASYIYCQVLQRADKSLKNGNENDTTKETQKIKFMTKPETYINAIEYMLQKLT